MQQKFEKKDLIKKSENFSDWYVDVIIKAGLADYAPVKGCMVFRPYGYAIWENIQRVLDEEIKKAGVKNAYFPLFIPESLLKREKEHLKGFSPELAVVTIGGGKELKEKLIVRPTSETIMHEMFAKWIKSWRDLPLLINQWCNVVRWEKRSRLFLRTTEFLWQEGHTGHATQKEAIEEARRALKMYQEFYRDFLAIQGICGKKSENEKFAGAVSTFTYELLMPDGKVVQGCTSHDLGQNFAKVFNIKFLDKDGKEKLVWQTSWGFTTRNIGVLVMVHGDNQGLVLPPRLAPIQIIIIPIFEDRATNRKLEKTIKKIKEELKDFRVEVDERSEYSVGWKFNEWELKGVPLRIEIGKKEIKENKITLVRRDNNEKSVLSMKLLVPGIRKTLDSIQKKLLEKSKRFLEENIREVSNYQEFKEIIKTKKGLIEAFWCGNPKCEKIIKKETLATTRCLPLENEKKKGKCVFCQKPAQGKWIFAQAY